MLYLNDVEYEKIYRKPVYLPKHISEDKKDMIKGKGELIFLFSDHIEKMPGYLKDERYFKNINNSFISYHLDSRYNVTLYNNKIVREKIDYKLNTARIKNMYPNIKKSFMKIEDYKGSNLFFDLMYYNYLFTTRISKVNPTQLNELYYTIKNTAETLNEGHVILDEAFKQYTEDYLKLSNYKLPIPRLSNLYFDFLKNNVFDRDFIEYKDRYLLIPIDYLISEIEVPKSPADFNILKLKNIFLLVFDWIFKGKFKEVPKMDIIITCNGAMIKIDSHNNGGSDKLIPILLKLFKLKDTVSGNRLGGTEEVVPPTMEQKESKSVNSVKNEIVNSIIGLYNSKKNVVGFTGEVDDVDNESEEETAAKQADTSLDEIDEETEELTSKTIDIVEKRANEIAEENSNMSPEELENKINSDTEIANAINNMKIEMLQGKSAASLKRDQKLREEFLSKKVLSGKMTVKQLLEKKTAPSIETTVIKRDVLNDDLNSMTVQNFDKTYRETMMERDIYNVIYAFANDPDIALIPRKIEVEDTSDKFNAKETITVEFEDSLRRRHKFQVDLPKFIDDKFIYLNGSRKIINKQLILLPICKTKPDTVQVSSNYKKIFIQRMGTNVSPTLEKFKKLLGSYKKDGLMVKTGSTIFLNKNYERTIEFDELSKRFIFIQVIDNKNKTKTHISFHIDKNYEDLNKYGLYIPQKQDNLIPIGYRDNMGIYIDTKNGHVVQKISKHIKNKTSYVTATEGDTGLGLTEYLYQVLYEAYGESFAQAFGELTVGRKYIYSRAKIMGKFIALALIMAYSETSIIKMLNKMDIKYNIYDKAPRYESPAEKMKYGLIKFKDAYLEYDATAYRNILLLEGLNEAPLKLYNLSDFDNKDTYLEIFETLLGSRTIANGFDNFKACMTDPITKEILEDLGYPTDYTEILGFANGLLEDNAYKMESDMSLYRLRSQELVPAYLYNTLSEAYGKYRITVANKNPIKVTVPRDKIIKEILTAPNVEEYSVLNPILELDKTRTVSFKGLSGLNLDDAYTIDKRTYHKSMLGILGSSTAYSGAVGVSRVMSLDSKIKSVRGYLNITPDEEVRELKAKQLFTPAEALAPFTATHDDSPRVLMTSTQAKHMVPVENSNKLLFGIGTDKIVANIMTDDYSFKAKEDGKVVELNKELGAMVVKYKSGKYDYINIGSEMSKNSSSGFYIDNKLEPNFKKGDTFKAQDILAMNPSYFGQDMIPGQVSYRAGTLAKVAIHSAYFTIEDATGISEELSEKMATSVVMPKHVVVGPNSNIDFICRVNDHVDVGDPLIIFDESYDSPEINKMLAKMNDKDRNEINDIGKHKVASKYNAEVVDIKIYYSTDFKSLSPSLQKLITKYNGEVNKKKNFAKKYIDDKFFLANKFEPTEKVEPDSRGKIKGISIDDGVLIEFYLKYRDSLGIGDKITYYTALKGIVSKIIPKEYSAYTEYRPDEPIDAFVGPIGVGARMTTSIETVMLGNKVLIELKRKLKELAYGK